MSLPCETRLPVLKLLELRLDFTIQQIEDAVTRVFEKAGFSATPEAK